jgi:hypothetical protein
VSAAKVLDVVRELRKEARMLWKEAGTIPPHAPGSMLYQAEEVRQAAMMATADALLYWADRLERALR